MRDVAVVIPTWNNVALTEACLDALRRQTLLPAEVCIVDNGSSDDTIARVQAGYPEVTICALPSNLGFAAAANRGIEATSAPLVALLNNDTVVDPRWLAELAGAAERHPDVLLFASLMVRHDEPDIVDSAGDGFDLHVAGPTSIAAGSEVVVVPDGDVRVCSPCAGAALYRRSLFDRVGFFDEQFFLTFEDVDLGLRAQLAGLDTVLVPTAVVRHVGGASTARTSLEYQRRCTRNRVWVLAKHLPLHVLPGALYRIVASDKRARGGSLWEYRGYWRLPIHAVTALPRRVRTQRLRQVSWPSLRARLVPDWRDDPRP